MWMHGAGVARLVKLSQDTSLLELDLALQTHALPVCVRRVATRIEKALQDLILRLRPWCDKPDPTSRVGLLRVREGGEVDLAPAAFNLLGHPIVDLRVGLLLGLLRLRLDAKPARRLHVVRVRNHCHTLRCRNPR